MPLVQSLVQIYHHKALHSTASPSSDKVVLNYAFITYWLFMLINLNSCSVFFLQY